VPRQCNDIFDDTPPAVTSIHNRTIVICAHRASPFQRNNDESDPTHITLADTYPARSVSRFIGIREKYEVTFRYSSVFVGLVKDIVALEETPFRRLRCIRAIFSSLYPTIAPNMYYYYYYYRDTKPRTLNTDALRVRCI